MVIETQIWTDKDYDEMSWHDNHVHGLQVEGGGEHGTGSLHLDLDYIVEWLPPVDGSFRWRIAPAILTFHDVFALKIELDWVGAGMTPFSISGIGREKREFAHGGFTWFWSIGVNWPEGFLSFESTGFTKTLRGPAISTSEQLLDSKQRKPAGA